MWLEFVMLTKAKNYKLLMPNDPLYWIIGGALGLVWLPIFIDFDIIGALEVILFQI